VTPSPSLFNKLLCCGTEGFAFFDVSNSSIGGNVSIGFTSDATVYIGGGDSQIDIGGNFLEAGVRAIQVQNPYSFAPNSGVTATDNTIQGNSIAGLEEVTGGYSPVSPGALDAKKQLLGQPVGTHHCQQPRRQGRHDH
jgi:hypothetical protein